jgi:hypothetical protein
MWQALKQVQQHYILKEHKINIALINSQFSGSVRMLVLSNCEY